MKTMRKIIEIDEELCNGCGQCIPGCAEGALAVIDGKARLVKEIFCDGLGACLGECPTGALTLVERESDPFDEDAALAHMAAREQAAKTRPHAPGGCPGAGMAVFEPAPASTRAAEAGECSPSQLGHWPVQIRLAPPEAPFLLGADLILAADCTAVALPDFHRDFVAGKAVLMGCPKFDEDYTQRLARLFAASGVASVTVLRMEVPCCGSLPVMAERALKLCGRDIPYRVVTVSRQGRIIEPAETAAGLLGKL